MTAPYRAREKRSLTWGRRAKNVDFSTKTGSKNALFAGFRWFSPSLRTLRTLTLNFLQGVTPSPGVREYGLGDETFAAWGGMERAAA